MFEFVHPHVVTNMGLAPQPQRIDQPNFTGMMSEMLSSFKESMNTFSRDISSRLEGLTAETKGHQSRLEQFLSQKRARSSSSDTSNHSSVSSQSRSSSRLSPSRSPSPSPAKRGSSAPSESIEADGEGWFIEDGLTWLWTTRRTEFVGQKVKIGGSLTHCIRHPTKQAFRTVSDTIEAESPFMGISQALDTVTAFLLTQHDSRDKMGPSNRSFRGQIHEDSDIHRTLKILLDSAPKAMDAIYRDDPKALESSFPASAFDPVSVINYNAGWTFTTEKDFSKFAKGDLLDLKEASDHLELDYTIKVPRKYLLEEKVARLRLIEYISSIGTLDNIIRKVEDPVLVEVLKAAARHCVSFLKDFAKVWYTAKFLVRKIALQYSLSPRAMQLLRSNMWEASLFAIEATTTFIEKDNFGDGTKARLLLSRGTNSDYGKKPQLADPSRQRRRERSRSNSPRRQAFHRRRPSNQGGPSNSSVHYAQRNNRASRPRKVPYKKQKVTFRNQETQKDSKASGPSKFYKNKFKKQ